MSVITDPPYAFMGLLGISAKGKVHVQTEANYFKISTEGGLPDRAPDSLRTFRDSMSFHNYASVTASSPQLLIELLDHKVTMEDWMMSHGVPLETALSRKARALCNTWQFALQSCLQFPVYPIFCGFVIQGRDYWAYVRADAAAAYSGRVEQAREHRTILLGKDSFTELENCLNMASRINYDFFPVSVYLEAFNQIDNQVHPFLDLIRALEGLYFPSQPSSESGFTKMLCKVVAFCLSKTDEGRVALGKMIADLYEVRSTLFHGREIVFEYDKEASSLILKGDPIFKKLKYLKDGSWNTLLSEARSIVERSILFLNECKALGNEERTEALVKLARIEKPEVAGLEDDLDRARDEFSIEYPADWPPPRM